MKDSEKVLGLKIGDIIGYIPDEKDNSVSGRTKNKVPAIITKVWDSETFDLTVFRDGPPLCKSAVTKEGTKKHDSADRGNWCIL